MAEQQSRPLLPTEDELHQQGLIYLMTNTPTIAEVRRLNRESPWLFPLPMLHAIINAGVDIDAESDATIEQFVWETEALIEMRWAVRRAGKLIAVIGESGVHDFRPVLKRKASP